MREYTVSEPTSLKNFTDVTDAQASLVFRTLLKAREIRVNGAKVRADCPLKAGDVVRYYMTPAQEAKRAFAVLYEDENVIVIDKESGVNAEAVKAALCRSMLSPLRGEGRVGGEIYFIHRIDRNTEGLLIFARNAAAEEELLRCFRERRVEKIYHALVLGDMPKLHAVEEAYLVKDDRNAFVHVSKEPRGEKIVTEYEVLEKRGACTLVKVTLHTGKTHQIRAHFAYLGHPIAGDEKYGDHAQNRAMGFKRQRLVAKELSLDCGGALSYLNGKRFVSEKNL